MLISQKCWKIQRHGYCTDCKQEMCGGLFSSYISDDLEWPSSLFHLLQTFNGILICDGQTGPSVHIWSEQLGWAGRRASRGFVYDSWDLFHCVIIASDGIKPRPHAPATMSKRHCRMLQDERFVRQSRMWLPHCCRFLATSIAGFGNNVADFGNGVERNFVLSTKSKQIEHVRNNFEATIDFVRSLSKESLVLYSMQQCCFDIVAGVDGA